LLLACAACATTEYAAGSSTQAELLETAPAPRSAPQGTQASGYPIVGSGVWGERTVFDAYFMPGAWMHFDDAGTANGLGYGARAAYGNHDQSVGLLYQGFDLDGDNTDVWLHSLYVDFDVRMMLPDSGNRLEFLAGVGVGGAWLDFTDANFGTNSEAAVELRLAMAFRPNPGFGLELGGGGALYGHFGNTAAYGSWLSLGASLTF
jgi:hypothetical protein